MAILAQLTPSTTTPTTMTTRSEVPTTLQKCFMTKILFTDKYTQNQDTLDQTAEATRPLDGDALVSRSR